MMEDSHHKGEIVIYQPDEITRLEVRVEGETVWLTQEQIALLFGVKRPAITKHIRNIFAIQELEELAVCSILERTASDGKTYMTQFYNLDMILSVGYRVNSKNAVMFRRWANSVLKEVLLKGFSINNRFLSIENQLNEHEGIFYDGQIFDAYVFVSDLVKSARRRIILIVDDVVYHIGASLKDLGKKLFAFSKLCLSPDMLL